MKVRSEKAYIQVRSKKPYIYEVPVRTKSQWRLLLVPLSDPYEHTVETCARVPINTQSIHDQHAINLQPARN